MHHSSKRMVSVNLCLKRIVDKVWVWWDYRSCLRSEHNHYVGRASKKADGHELGTSPEYSCAQLFFNFWEV